MTCPLRALALAAVAATLGLVPHAGAQAPAMPPAAPPPQAAPPPPPPPPPPVPPAARSVDPFGEEITLPAKTIIFLKGNGTWDTAFETLLDAFKSVYAYLDTAGIKPAGPAMTIYTQADDTGFSFQAAVPVAEEPKDPPKGDMAVGKSPSGRALKFVHHGSYDQMDNTYEAITNYLDEKRLEAQDVFVEEYQTDLRTTPEDKLEVFVFVPLK
jgi:effector-binding domain-containing protein